MIVPCLDTDTALSGHYRSRQDDGLTLDLSATRPGNPTTPLSELQDLTGGVAHDLNNLLTVIIGASEALAEDLEAGSPSQDLALVSLRAAEHGAGLLRRLIAFARGETPQAETVDCAAALDSVAALTATILPEAITITAKPSAYPLFCQADQSELESALLNLCINARDATVGRGALSLGCEAVWMEGEAARAEGLTTGSYVAFSVTDTGLGMSPETLSRALEPYFTTKADRGGTSLGLSSAQGFARRLGGGLTIATRLGHGTTVRLYLPRIDLRPAARRAAPSLPPHAQRPQLVRTERP